MLQLIKRQKNSMLKKEKKSEQKKYWSQIIEQKKKKKVRKKKSIFVIYVDFHQIQQDGQILKIISEERSFVSETITRGIEGSKNKLDHKSTAAKIPQSQQTYLQYIQQYNLNFGTINPTCRNIHSPRQVDGVDFTFVFLKRQYRIGSRTVAEFKQQIRKICEHLQQSNQKKRTMLALQIVILDGLKKIQPQFVSLFEQLMQEYVQYRLETCSLYNERLNQSQR